MNSIKYFTFLTALVVMPCYSAIVDPVWHSKYYVRNSDGMREPLPVNEISQLSLKKEVIKETNIPPSAAEVLSKNTDLTYLGDFNGRKYYERSIWLNWYRAKDFCEDRGLEMIELNSAALWTFIYWRLEPFTVYWTAAKDAENRDQFLAFGQNVNRKLSYMHSRIIKSESCIGVAGSNPTFWETISCLEEKFVLCQSL